MVSLRTYSTLSALITATVCFNAWYTRRQFYPTVLYLATSKLCVCVLGNMALVFTLLVGQFTRKMFFGALRDVEVEHLLERSRDAIMETCLAMTIFRQDFDIRLITLFTALLFVKIFHWLAQDRVEFIEQSPAIPVGAHIRVLTLLAILLFVDAMFLWTAVTHTVEKGPSVLILFGFEYTILASTVVSTYVKYALHAVDIHMEGRWEARGVYVFYLDLTTDLFQLLVYFFFFMIIFSYYGLPLHIIRDLYLTFRNFRKRIADYFRYRRVTANMNERFPDATAEEMLRVDRTCIICREEMTVAKRLPCSHLFHLHCLRSWLERQQSCPTCRTPLETPAAVPGTTPPPEAAAPARPALHQPAGADALRIAYNVPGANGVPPAQNANTSSAQHATSEAATAPQHLADGLLGSFNHFGNNGMPLGPTNLAMVSTPFGVWPFPPFLPSPLGMLPAPFGFFVPGLSPVGATGGLVLPFQPPLQAHATSDALGAPDHPLVEGGRHGTAHIARDGQDSGQHYGSPSSNVPAVLGSAYFAQLQAQIECLQHQLFVLTGDSAHIPASSDSSLSAQRQNIPECQSQHPADSDLNS